MERSNFPQTFNDFLDQFIRKGEAGVEALQLRLNASGDVGSRTALENLLQIHAKYVNELRTQFDEIRSREEITKEINDMFKL
ncbi:MAG: hypothetical protein HY563_06530 [Ignavibacteriales bacterium]|nr:hypothetical protein [Ignavibacteriales bacterium]